MDGESSASGGGAAGILSRASKTVGPHMLVLVLVLVGLLAGLLVGVLLLLVMRRRAVHQQALTDKLEADALTAMTAGPSDSACSTEHSAYEVRSDTNWWYTVF